MGQLDLSADLAFAHGLADAAAEVSLSWFGHRLPVEQGGRDPGHRGRPPCGAGDPEGDRERFPGDGVLGEEEGLDEGKNGRRWVIDPVDGTKLYAEGIPLGPR